MVDGKWQYYLDGKKCCVLGSILIVDDCLTPVACRWCPLNGKQCHVNSSFTGFKMVANRWYCLMLSGGWYMVASRW